MPYDFHENRKLYFRHQTETTRGHIIPFIQNHKGVEKGMHVLEIGCGEAGVLKAFTEMGCRATGVELNTAKFYSAGKMMATEIERGQLDLINNDIYENEFKNRFKDQFDLIILKDVIEHIPDQERLMNYLHTFLNMEGIMFFSFPPWQMPFGGHQQMCKGILRKMPYFHLLPKPIYTAILKFFNEPNDVIQGLLANKQTGISIERFERILKKNDYCIMDRIYFLSNPIYKYKFKLKPREQYRFISRIPYFRNFLTTAVYYLIKPVK